MPITTTRFFVSSSSATVEAPISIGDATHSFYDADCAREMGVRRSVSFIGNFLYHVATRTERM